MRQLQHLVRLRGLLGSWEMGKGVSGKLIKKRAGRLRRPEGKQRNQQGTKEG